MTTSMNCYRFINTVLFCELVVCTHFVVLSSVPLSPLGILPGLEELRLNCNGLSHFHIGSGVGGLVYQPFSKLQVMSGSKHV